MIKITFSNDYAFYESYFILHDSIGIFNKDLNYIELYKYKIEKIYIENNELHIINNENEFVVPCIEIKMCDIEI